MSKNKHNGYFNNHTTYESDLIEEKSEIEDADDTDSIVDKAEDVEEESPKNKDVVNLLYVPSTGRKVILKNVPVYNKPYSSDPKCMADGEFYYYDYTIINNRVKITQNPNIAKIKKNPDMIYGYIEIT